MLRFILTVTYGPAEPHSPPRRGGEDAPPIRWREATESGADGVWSDRHVLDFAELTTPALRATPPLRGGEFVNAIFKRNTSKGET